MGKSGSKRVKMFKIFVLNAFFLDFIVFVMISSKGKKC